MSPVTFEPIGSQMYPVTMEMDRVMSTRYKLYSGIGIKYVPVWSRYWMFG